MDPNMMHSGDTTFSCPTLGKFHVADTHTHTHTHTGSRHREKKKKKKQMFLRPAWDHVQDVNPE
ncbi:hypothetical protein JOB18_031694 [Solea senegalensis]|uniref:Uncharacterized protein n=1 Tax=Solea senegalensis TaxID=28829 RepID=A0AAV6PNR4_SOLSE|nr:hypothetical protein JOB18_031694 [Solea senegalensis]